LNLTQNSRITIEQSRDLHFRLSKSVSITPVQNNASGAAGGVSPSGALRMHEQRESLSSTVIDISDIGTLLVIDSNVIEVSFNKDNKDYQLRFRRNPQSGRYDLFSAVFGIGTSSLRYDGSSPPQLLILVEEPTNRQPIQAVPNPASGGSQRRIDYVPERENNWQFYPENINYFPTNPSINPSKQIMGQGSVTKAGITAYVISQNRSVNRATLSSLIDTYICEAEIEGINYDIAIAQMLYWTESLTNQSRMRSNNFGGLSAEGLRWDGTFPRLWRTDGMTEGVRAHIQHLKGYASTRRPTNIVDPRYEGLGTIRGTIQTFELLYERWMPNNLRYGNSIDSILNELYRLSVL
jgi:hypothetical protein